MGKYERSCEAGEASTILEVKRSVTTRHAYEFRGLKGAFGLFFTVFSKGQAERRRGPSEVASAFLFPSYC